MGSSSADTQTADGCGWFMAMLWGADRVSLLLRRVVVRGKICEFCNYATMEQVLVGSVCLAVALQLLLAAQMYLTASVVTG